MSTSGQQPNPIPPEAQARIRELQVLITQFQRRADKTRDEDIREALNLQVSSLGLKVSRLQHGMPEDPPPEPEKAPEEEAEPMPVPTAEQLESADKLIQRARLEKSRGNKQAASDLLKQAVDVAPGASTVLEALGDDYADRKQYVAARDTYKKAHRADPKNASVERKLAQLSMTGVADLSFEDQLRYGSFDSPFIQQNESLASPQVAVILSVMVPGLGQIVKGQTKKGLAILLIFVVSSIAVIVLYNLTHAVGHKAIPTLVYAATALAIATWVGGVADAGSSAKRSPAIGGGMFKRPKDPPNRPVPPVNLPFE